MAQTIDGWSPNDRVPGAAGKVNNNVGGTTAGSFPAALLVIGLMAGAAAITPDQDVVQIFTDDDADHYAGIGSEGACMLYDAIAEANELSVPVYYASPTPQSGSTAASLKVKFFGGNASTTGTVAVRINGKVISAIIQIGWTPAQAATALATFINGFNSGRSRLSATATGAYLQIVCNTPGVRGMQDVVFLDTSAMPSGMQAQLYTTWAAAQTYAVGDQVIPKTAPAGLYMTVITASGSPTVTEPSWPSTEGQTVTDSVGNVYQAWGAVATGNAPTQALFLGNGVGLETYTNLLLTLANQKYAKIVLAANDAVSLAAWKAQIDTLAMAPTNYLQKVVIGTNGSFAAAQSIGQTTLNDVRFQNLWELNAETHPSRFSSTFACLRTGVEASNPNASYDGQALDNVAPQSQKADWPVRAVLIAAINNSVTPITSGDYGLGPGGDGTSRIVRSITTKSLTNGFPDYSALDTGVPETTDFIWDDAKAYYLTDLQPNNPVVEPDPADGERVPSGVLVPSTCTSLYVSRITPYSEGVLSGTPSAGSATIPPIIQAPQPGDVQSVWNGQAKRIDVTINARDAQQDHQLGIIVNQLAT